MKLYRFDSDKNSREVCELEDGASGKNAASLIVMINILVPANDFLQRPTEQ